MLLLLPLIIALTILTPSAAEMCDPCDFPHQMVGGFTLHANYRTYMIPSSSMYEMDLQLKRARIYTQSPSLVIYNLEENRMYKFQDRSDLSKGDCKFIQLPDSLQFPNHISQGFNKISGSGETLCYRNISPNGGYDKFYVSPDKNSVCQPTYISRQRPVDNKNVFFAVSVTGYKHAITSNSEFVADTNRCTETDFDSF